MFLDSAVASLIGDVYDAALDPSSWGRALAAIAELLGAPSAFLEVRRPNGRQTELIATSGLGVGSVDAHNIYSAAKEIWSAEGEALPRCKPLVLSHHLQAAQVTDAGHGPLHIIGAWLETAPEELALVSFHRHPGSAGFTAKNCSTLDAVLPHLSRALVIRSRLLGFAGRGAVEACALDTLSFGVVITQPDGRVVYANSTAERLAAEADGFSLGSDDKSLAASSAPITAKLRRLIATAARAGARPSSRAISLPRPSGRQALIVVVMTLPPGRTGATASDEPFAILVVHNPELESGPIRVVLQDAFGLTPAEARIADGLASCASIEGLSEFYGISIETVRSHLKSIFLKTERRRQSEVMALLARLDAARVGQVPGSFDRLGDAAE
jgi:DNA-binding CsgD family transcriptional regulator